MNADTWPRSVLAGGRRAVWGVVVEATVLTAGLVCVIAAIARGGLEAFGIKMPLISSTPRQVILGAFGLFLVMVALLPNSPFYLADGEHDTSSVSRGDASGTETDSSTSDGCQAVNEQFDAQSLDEAWQQINGKAFDVQTGVLAITAPDGADVRSDIDGDITAPFLARDVVGDFSLETVVRGNPQHSYQGAGLLLYRDSDNYVRLERGFGDQGAIAFEYAFGGAYVKVHGPFSGDPNPVPTSANVVRLRLVRTGSSVRAYWRPAGTSQWVELERLAPLDGNVKAGITVVNRSQPPMPDPSRRSLTATFAYVKIDC